MPAVVQYAGTLPGLYENGQGIVYGVGAGTFKGQNASGGTITQPLVAPRFGISNFDQVPAFKPKK